MAITLLQTPSALYATFAVYEECIYVVKESSIGAYKFNYTAAIEHYNGTSYDAVASLRIPKNSVDAGVFDVGEVLRSYMAYTFNQVAGGLFDPVGAEQFRITFGSEQALTANGAPIANADTVVEVSQFWNGIARNPTESFGPNASTKFALNGSTSRMLTTSGWPNYNPRYSVSLSDFGSIDLMLGMSGLSASQCVLRYYRGSTQLTSNTISIPGLGATAATAVSRFWCYPAAFEFLGAGNQKPSAAANTGWTHYTVQFQNVGDRSVTHTFVLEDDCAAQSVSFAWLNEFGGWEYMRTKGNWNLTTNYQDKSYEQTRGNWFNAGTGTLYQSTYEQRGLSRIVMDTERVFTINTGTLLKEDTPRVESLLRSRYVLAVDPESDQFLYKPCVLMANSLRHIHPWTPDIVQYTFDMKFANQPVTIPL